MASIYSLINGEIKSIHQRKLHSDKNIYYSTDSQVLDTCAKGTCPKVPGKPHELNDCIILGCLDSINLLGQLYKVWTLSKAVGRCWGSWFGPYTVIL